MASSMTAPARASLEPHRFPVTLRVTVAPMLRRVEPARREDAECGEVPSAAGCLRGLCWGLALEGAAAAVIYGLWRLALVLR